MLGKKKKKDKATEDDAQKDEDAKGEKDTATEGEAGAEGEGAEGEGAPKKSKKKMMIIGGAVAVLLIAAGAGAYFTGMIGGKGGEGEEAAQEHGGGEHGAAATIVGPDGKPMTKPIFYTLPDFLVNLNAQGKASSYLKATIVIELARQGDLPLVEANLPRISDAFTTYLRELRPGDLAGSAGIQRLREELVLRVNKVVTPVKVSDVLFKDIVVQ
jgi:flagellar protein FliL